MILVHLGLQVVFEQREKHIVDVQPSLSADFTLQCLFCGCTHQLKPPLAYIIRKGEKPHTYIYPIQTCIKQTRACTNCGIISTLPEVDEKRLAKELEKKITQDFIDQHSGDKPPFLAQRLMDWMIQKS
jgi:hypothetical protein